MRRVGFILQRKFVRNAEPSFAGYRGRKRSSGSVFNAFRLAKLAMCDRLSTWERGFVASVAKQKKLSPKQLAVLERLVRQYLEGGAP
jgi:hypothetical protein